MSTFPNYGFFIASHAPDQTKYLSNDLRNHISGVADILSKRMNNGKVRKSPRAYLKHDKFSECWVIARVITSTKSKLENKVIAIIGEEFKDITKRFDSVKPELSYTCLPKIRQKIHSRRNTARYLRQQEVKKK